ncbi:MAG: hypothetical protein MJ132_08210 [Clostridia bacterium]|nr:hypothetical protein [Clostridia bacterium]
MKKILAGLLVFSLLFGCSGCRFVDEIKGILFHETVTDDFWDENTTLIEPMSAEEIKRNYSRQYEQLTEKQQYIYRIMYSAANQMLEGWFRLEIDTANYTKDIALAFQALSNDHPEMFWLPYNYLLRKSSAGVQLTFSYKTNEYSYDYLIPIEARENMRAELEEKAAEILAEAPEDPLEAEIYLHDCLCEKVTYDDQSKDKMVYTAYGALVEGEAVCEGYARAMQYLCQRAGISCTLIVGEYKGEGHMWNLIQFADEWYHLDVTWDDGGDIPRYYYFNLTDKEILQDHKIVQSAQKTDADAFEIGKSNLFLPTCTSDRFNYYVYYDLLIEREDPEHIAKCIVEAQRHGKEQLQFHITDKAYLRKFKEDAQDAVNPIQKAISRMNGADPVTNIMTSDDYVTFLWK